MENAQLISLSRQIALQRQMDVVANNMANINTAGYKNVDILFEEYIMPTARHKDFKTLDQPLSFTQDWATIDDFASGSIELTGNELDMAIQGDGFFQILQPDGTLAYTRDGAFQSDINGQLVTSSGFVLQPAITIPPNTRSITIGRDGTVSVVVPGSEAPVQVGNMQLASFINPAGLQKVGENLYLQTASSGVANQNAPGTNGMGILNQGFVETSNVNVVEELVNMIETQRAYEVNSKMISATDDMLQFVNQQI